MGNFCSTPRADEDTAAGGVLTLDGTRARSPAPTQKASEAPKSQPGQPQPQPVPVPGASSRPATAAQVADESQVCSGSKLEQLAVEYLSKEVGSDRAVHGQAPSSASAANATVVEDVEAVEEKEIRWQQGELIGAGAFGRVYLGLNLDTGQLMAVKQVSVAKDETNLNLVAEHVRSLEAEVNVLKQLHHPNIVRYMGTERGRDRMSLNIFLEFVPGGSIASLLAKFGCFTESVLRVYTKQILLGLEFLHTHQIMHRDIKGANILVDNRGVVKLADFGASKKIEDLVTMDSGFKSIKGTPYWMAPEVIKQTGHGRQADIWSVGCTVIEMATGKPPWSQFAAPVSALFHIASSKGPPPLPEHLSPEAKDFLLLCFNRSPKDRPNATRLLQHPFLTTAIPISSAAPSRIPAAAAPTPAAPPPPRPAPPTVAVPPAPPPEFGTGFRYVPKPLTPVVEAGTPAAQTEAHDNMPTAGPSESGSEVFAGDHTTARHDPMMESVAFSVDSVMSSVSYNPVEEPSWLQSMDNPMDPSDFLTPEGLPPPQPMALYGKENKGPRRLAANLPSVSSKNKSLAPIEPSGPPEIRGDEANIMQYVREKAVRETVRLSTPFLETKPPTPPPNTESSGGPQVLSLETSISPQVMRLDGPSPKPTGGRRVGRPVRPSQTAAHERMSKSQQWKEELEKELQEKRLKAKTPREPDGPGGFHRQFSRDR